MPRRDSSARMTVHDALDHPWLREDRPDADSRIPSSRYDNMRQRIRGRYVRELVRSEFNDDDLI